MSCLVFLIQYSIYMLSIFAVGFLIGRKFK